MFDNIGVIMSILNKVFRKSLKKNWLKSHKKLTVWIPISNEGVMDHIVLEESKMKEYDRTKAPIRDEFEVDINTSMKAGTTIGDLRKNKVKTKLIKLTHKK